MDDQKPPRSIGDERATLVGLLQYQRDSFVRKLEGVEEAAAATPSVPSGITLLWLAQHMADAEVLWVVHRFAGLADAGVEPLEPSRATIDRAIDRYHATWQRVDAIVAAADLDDVCVAIGDDGPPADLRWVLAHLLEETARHAGHADILRELIDGQTGR